ncbi:MAG TPA: sulfite exporter TauE/SafE family protein [Saprospiraceae bacterium]|nr:sulfite exporter TauE/SafE family protein [Saprospiraceae bacterium]
MIRSSSITCIVNDMEGSMLGIIFLLLLFIVSLLYSSVGHGGASGYIALMTVWGIEATTVKSTALVLNCFVSLIAFIQYYRQGYFNWRLTFPFLITSVPMAYLGALMEVDGNVYKKILGGLLILSILRLVIMHDLSPRELRPLNLVIALLAGGAIGFLSGMIGIGGGILLSPLIVLAGWAGMKQTAATSAIFIFINSLAGLAGVFTKHQFTFSVSTTLWLGIALSGALIGAYWGSGFAAVKQMRYILAFVLTIASVKLLFF